MTRNLLCALLASAAAVAMAHSSKAETIAVACGPAGRAIVYFEFNMDTNLARLRIPTGDSGLGPQPFTVEGNEFRVKLPTERLSLAIDRVTGKAITIMPDGYRRTDDAIDCNKVEAFPPPRLALTSPLVKLECDPINGNEAEAAFLGAVPRDDENLLRVMASLPSAVSVQGHPVLLDITLDREHQTYTARITDGTNPTRLHGVEQSETGAIIAWTDTVVKLAGGRVFELLTNHAATVDPALLVNLSTGSIWFAPKAGNPTAVGAMCRATQTPPEPVKLKF